MRHSYSADYSREELVAEVGSASLCAEAGIETALDNSAAYLRGWREALKGDARMIVTAASATRRRFYYLFAMRLQPISGRARLPYAGFNRSHSLMRIILLTSRQYLQEKRSGAAPARCDTSFIRRLEVQLSVPACRNDW